MPQRCHFSIQALALLVSTFSLGETPLTDQSLAKGTYIHRGLMFASVLLFRKWVAAVLIGTYIHGYL